MVRALSVFAACLLAGTSGAEAGLDATPSQLGFGYCPPPVIPGCIEGSARHASRAGLDACSREVLRFTQTLGAYRVCLTRESERAIGTGNAAIARFRCLSQHGTVCR